MAEAVAKVQAQLEAGSPGFLERYHAIHKPPIDFADVSRKTRGGKWRRNGIAVNYT